ncbi:alpha/beta hydrolase family protein [Isoptericola jiangsuensis]|uniref:alpha/beta hydrolase family protein n=1 Tax=Isoptericola jiangsuensis TaxID=548579 RepID=UPI003AAFB953
MQHSTSTRRVHHRVTGILAGLAVAVGGALAAGPASAADNPYERGPNPTENSIEASRGSYSVSSSRVSSLVSGFGGGTIYYPTTRSDGTFGAVVVSPGYTGTESSISWLGPRIASQGFVVLTMATNTIYDQPDQRARQLQAALDHLTSSSSGVADRIDPDRLALMGHSMGGGGTLRAVADNPDIKAAIPLTPWHTDKTWGEVRTPTLIFGAEYDTVAPHYSHAEPFYSSLPRNLPKAYLELNGASHFAPNTSDTTIAKYSISWLKRFVDDDTRYSQFVCPGPSSWDLDVQKYEATCPF